MAFLFKEIKSIKQPEETEQCMLKHGEAIIDTIGAEIDRIEMKLKVNKSRINILEIIVFCIFSESSS